MTFNQVVEKYKKLVSFLLTNQKQFYSDIQNEATKNYYEKMNINNFKNDYFSKLKDTNININSNNYAFIQYLNVIYNIINKCCNVNLNKEKLFNQELDNKCQIIGNYTINELLIANHNKNLKTLFDETNNFKLSKDSSTNSTSIIGGGEKDIYYEKYLKYKNKYLELKYNL
jgi:hypothetical protein